MGIIDKIKKHSNKTKTGSLPFEQAVEAKTLTFPESDKITLFSIEKLTTVEADPYSQSSLERTQELIINLNTGELTRETVYKVDSQPLCTPNYTIPENESVSVSYRDLPALIKKSPDKDAKKYIGMNSRNWRKIIQKVYMEDNKPSPTRIEQSDLLDSPRMIEELYLFSSFSTIWYFRKEDGVFKLFCYKWESKDQTVNMAAKFAENGREMVRYIKQNALKNEEWFDRTCNTLDIKFILSKLEKYELFEFPRRTTMPFIDISPEYEDEYQNYQLWYIENGVRYYIDFQDLNEFDDMRQKAVWALRPVINGITLDDVEDTESEDTDDDSGQTAVEPEN